MKNTLANETLNKLNQTVKGTPTFTGTSCEGNCTLKENGLYYGEDDFGDSYVYRGSVDNNWVVFGQDTKNSSEYIWWRIIRINGNGTLRLIYAGTSSNKTEAPKITGETTMINPTKNAGNKDYPRGVYFNEQYNDNKYVGYMYNSSPETSTNIEEAHKVTSSSTKSTILTQIELWYKNDTDLSELADKIDVDTGFCSDTTPSTKNHGSYYPGTGNLGYGSTATAYAGTDRVLRANYNIYKSDKQTPTLKCGTDETRKRDLYTDSNATSGGTKGSSGTNVEGNNALPVPVGLITMDEVIYAGGFAGTSNNGYWLYTNQDYWTMSPSTFYDIYAGVFDVQNMGNLMYYGVNNPRGIRPVINLKSTVTFEPGGDGTSTKPYVVKTD